MERVKTLGRNRTAIELVNESQTLNFEDSWKLFAVLKAQKNRFLGSKLQQMIKKPRKESCRRILTR